MHTHQLRPTSIDRPSAAVIERDAESHDSTRQTGVVVVGVGGARRNASVAICVDGQVRAFCEQERLTRVRRVGLEGGRVPEEALGAVLGIAGRQPSDIDAYAVAEESVVAPGSRCFRFNHHLGHAATAFYTSPFLHAAVVVCDEHASPPVSVWTARETNLTDLEWSWGTDGFAALYSDCAEIFGFARGQEHRLEALARLGDGRGAERLHSVFRYTDGSLRIRPNWQTVVADWLGEDAENLGHRALVASAVQRRLGELLLQFAADVKALLRHDEHLCLGGGLFYNSYFNTLLAESGLFRATYVPPNPGNPGLAAGAALAVDSARRSRAHQGLQAVTPFLGPAFDAEQVKATLDNCKLSYEYLSEADIVAAVVDALTHGLLVAWFQEGMEWGPRALGNRSILADPRSPYVLENLNVFLKHRERHHTYGVSVCEEDLPRFFIGPSSSRYMEHDYQVADAELFKYVIPIPGSTVRVQTVDGSPRLFRQLLETFGAATGVGVLVNTSLNGFSEPMACTPRDAVRVFFGTGLDVLVIGRFLIRK